MSVLRVIRRLGAALLFVAVVSTIALILARQAPGDYTDTLRAARMPAEAIERERTRLYLDRSLPELSAVWLAGLARLDLGTSFRFSRPVTTLIAERAPRTLVLVLISLVLAIGGGVVWGTLLVSGGRVTQRALSALSTLSLSIPSIVILFMLMFVMVRLGWLGRGSETFIVPALGIIALLLPAAGGLARVHAEALDQALAEPWSMASVSRGISPALLVWKLAMRIAIARVFSMLPLLAANLFGVSLLVEVVSGWAGLGRLMLDGLVARDMFLVAGCTAAIAAAIAVLGVVSDAIVAALDPRVEFSEPRAAAQEPAS